MFQGYSSPVYDSLHIVRLQGVGMVKLPRLEIVILQVVVGLDSNDESNK